MNTVRGFVRSIEPRDDENDRVAVLLNSGLTVRVTVPRGTLKVPDKIRLDYEPGQRSYSYTPPD